VGKDKTYGSMVVQDKRTNQLEKVKPTGSNPYAWDRSTSHNPLLMPVENLAQWKALKAKGHRNWGLKKRILFQIMKPGPPFNSSQVSRKYQSVSSPNWSSQEG